MAVPVLSVVVDVVVVSFGPIAVPRRVIVFVLLFVLVCRLVILELAVGFWIRFHNLFEGCGDEVSVVVRWSMLDWP